MYVPYFDRRMRFNTQCEGKNRANASREACVRDINDNKHEKKHHVFWKISHTGVKFVERKAIFEY